MWSARTQPGARFSSNRKPTHDLSRRDATSIVKVDQKLSTDARIDTPLWTPTTTPPAPPCENVL